ncbi:flippase-like domain-containing protein [Janibacter hoylei]|uniref:flippase-like domain-containing protein n=1 Tax=Janibacter hoylei TaxID=364298 RepID=UPI0021A84F12|nr:flippase-like domain-containing protein [Janibacter hoylei]MCT2292484.1 flippase-like domain-containing protein [Janibacter hoylei]
MTAPTTPVRSGRKRLLDVLRIGFLVVVLVAVGIALWSNWEEVQGDLGRLGPVTILGAVVLSLLSPFFTVLGWRVLLADLGSRLHIAQASGVFFVGQLGKYLPGSVWSVVVQTEMAAKLGVPRRRSAVVGLLCIALSALTGMIAGLPALPVLLTRGDAVIPWWALLLIVAVLGILLWPPLLNHGIRTLLRLLRREPLEHDLSHAAVGLSSLWFTLSWLVGGLAVWVMARNVAPDDADASRLLLVAVSGYLLAAGIGMFSIVVPAGVGVRDGVMVLLLTTQMSVSAATAVVVVARFLTVLADVVWAALGWLWAKSHDLLPDGGTPTTDPDSSP